MKKIPSFIPVAIMFMILAVLLVFMCLPQNQNIETAVKGILSLRNETAKIYTLHGEWDFVYGELLSPDELHKRQTDTVVVPGSWSDLGYPLNGFATFRLTVMTEGQDELMLYLPEISSAYILWINGEITRTAGNVSVEAEENRPFFENVLIPVTARNGVVELVLQVSNYQFMYAGINDTILLGESGSVQSWYFRTRMFSCLALGCILMAAFYHFTLFIYRRREKTYLLFALLCFLCFVRFLMETNGINEYFQWIPMNMLGIRFFLSMFFSHSLAISAFSLYVFNRDFLKKHRIIIVVCFTAVLAAGIFTPTNNAAYIIVTTAATMPVIFFTIIMAARSRVLKENRMLRLYFAALIVFFIVGTSTKLFFDNMFFMAGLLSNMFLIMSQSLVLSRQYTDAFRLVEKTNANLEQLVDERTQSLQAANSAMQATNIAMKELVSNISHDLKTPLAIMSLNLETLSGLAVTQSNADYQRHVRTAYRKNLDLQRLIQNLFEVSRIETGRHLYSPKWISILHILAQAEDKYDVFLDDKGIALEIIMDDDIEISADPQKIWSVFDNIIYNAARYTESGGKITIITSNTETDATVTVTDSGCGIAPEHLPHIFKRFYRVSQSRNASEGESGLGLYIVKSVMEGCGGSVDAESEQGKGTSIILNFRAKKII